MYFCFFDGIDIFVEKIIDKICMFVYVQLDCGLQLFDNYFLDGSKWDWFLFVIYKYIVMEKFVN